MKTIPCSLCGETRSQPVYTLGDSLEGLPGEFQLVRCAGCGFLYLNPQPEWTELEQHYPADYFPHRAAAGGLGGAIQRSGGPRRVKLVRQFARPGRLLDVGCGAGQFLADMGKAGGWERQGLEPVAAAAALARQAAGCPVFEGTLPQAGFESASFDVVTLWDVLEHVAAPAEDLREVARILKPGGLAVIRTPDPSSVLAGLFGASWANYDAPRHLGLFPRRLLEAALVRQGFEILAVRFLASEYFTVFASLAAYFSARRMGRAAAVCRAVLGSPLLRLVSAPLFFIPALFQSGSSPVLVARRKA